MPSLSVGFAKVGPFRAARGEDETVQLPTEPCFEQLKLTYRALRSMARLHAWALVAKTMARPPGLGMSAQKGWIIVNMMEWSRRNVMQSDAKSIKAFCLGCIKPYFTPLTISAKTRLLLPPRPQ
ncbi:unnamed protein product [Effrenium voratum]|uniref:Uncharacterized protein n=1 Tax=Effrenium voratum TaxID=2562239 RepID=A0AA36IS91_9DINO|nr:unnamed protein product [Effrenium voratum]